MSLKHILPILVSVAGVSAAGSAFADEGYWAPRPEPYAYGRGFVRGDGDADDYPGFRHERAEHWRWRAMPHWRAERMRRWRQYPPIYTQPYGYGYTQPYGYDAPYGYQRAYR